MSVQYHIDFKPEQSLVKVVGIYDHSGAMKKSIKYLSSLYKMIKGECPFWKGTISFIRFNIFNIFKMDESKTKT